MLVTLLWMVLAAQGAPRAVTEVGWLSGCWKYATGARTVTEFWLPPDGGTMMGLSRTVSGDKTVEYEFLLLRSGPSGIEYVARPSRQAEAVFTATKVASDEVVFENPQHDFPTRITYRKVSGGVTATVDGTVNGKTRSIDFKYSAASCQP